MNLEINRDELLKQGEEEGRDRAIRLTYTVMKNRGNSLKEINQFLLDVFGSQDIIDAALEDLD